MNPDFSDSRDERIVWIVSEGSPGHETQSRGVAEALGRLLPTPLNICELAGSAFFRGFVRSCIRRLWMGKKGKSLPDWVLRRWCGVDMKAVKMLEKSSKKRGPDLIISSGVPTLFPARSLAAKYGAPFIYIGNRKYPPEWFHTVFTLGAHRGADCDVVLDLLPVEVSPESAQKAAEQWKERPTGRLWSMLIGGNSRSRAFESLDWEELANAMISLAEKHGIRWLVTTSRRTGKEAEDLLTRLLPSHIIADAIWWGRKPEKKLAAYIGAAEAVWVTVDSVSMVTEAVTAGKSTLVLSPRTFFPEKCYEPGYLENLEKSGRLILVPISKMAEAIPPPPVSPTNSAETMAQELLIRLKWQ